MTPNEFKDYMKILNWDNVTTAKFLGKTEQTICNYLHERQRIPEHVRTLFKMCIMLKQIQQN